MSAPAPPLRHITVTRYVTPLREGGSVPAIVEASDAGLYVVKFRGAGQGVRALIAELVCAGLARTLGLLVPELVLVEVDAALGRNEPDAELRELLRASVGLNLALDYLPGSLTFDPVAGPPPDAQVASEIVWFDALVTNVDRTARNPNLLVWHRRLHLIDHGAALYFHHAWEDVEKKALSPFPAIRDHVLLPWASALEDADRRLRPRLDRAALERVLAAVPDAWLEGSAPFPTAAAAREAYVRFLEQRLASSSHFLEEAVRARAARV